MKKLLASDLDGTLIFNGKLKEIDVKSVSLLREENIFGISTGRPYNGVSFLKKDYNLEADFYILLNGAFILDKDLNVLKHERISFDVVNEIFLKYNSCYVFGVDEGKETSILFGKNNYTWENTKYKTIEDLKHIDTSLISIGFLGDSVETTQRVCDEINKDFSNYVTAYRNANFIDVVPSGCSKGKALESVAKIFGIALENVYAIGDSFNDLSMFEFTNNSFTFPHAEKDVQNKAKYMVDSVSECINKYILG